MVYDNFVASIRSQRRLYGRGYCSAGFNVANDSSIFGIITTVASQRTSRARRLNREYLEYPCLNSPLFGAFGMDNDIFKYKLGERRDNLRIGKVPEKVQQAAVRENRRVFLELLKFCRACAPIVGSCCDWLQVIYLFWPSIQEHTI